MAKGTIAGIGRWLVAALLVAPLGSGRLGAAEGRTPAAEAPVAAPSSLVVVAAADANSTHSALPSPDVKPARAVVSAPVTPAPAAGPKPPPPPTPTPKPAKDDDAKPALDIPPIGRILSEGELLIVAPGQNLTVESPAQSERRLPVFDRVSGTVRWAILPAREKQVMAIRWLDTSNIKKLVEVEMLEGDLFLAASPREQTDLSLAVRGRKTGLAFDAPGGWTAVDHHTLKVHLEVDASLRVVGYSHPLLPAGDDPARDLGLHLFASLRPGAAVQNAGDTTLVIEQYSTQADGRWSDQPQRVVLPPETGLSTNGGRYDLRHFYVPEPGQPAGPLRVDHVSDNPPLDRQLREGFGAGSARAADAPAGVLP